MRWTRESDARVGLAPLLAFLACLPLAASACGDGSRAGDRGDSFNVIFLLVDTLRADHLGAYGYTRETSPILDAFAAESALFEQVRSQAACTYPSANSLLTSRYPTHFLDQPDGRMGIPQGISSVAEILQDHGYATVAVSASPIVRRSPTRFNPEGGFDRGFDVFNEACHLKPAACINREAIKYLRGGPSRFFLYLHYMDPHGPYSPPANFERPFGAGYQGKDFIARGEPLNIERMLYGNGPDLNLTEEDIQHLVDLYDSEISYFDEQFGSLLESIEELGLREETIIVVASDHGEEFMDHGSIKHCHTLYDSEIKTPLILRVPSRESGVRVSSLAQNLDIVPTILDYLGIEADGRDFEGRSLRPIMEGESPVNDYIFSAQGTLRAVSDRDSKLINDLKDGSYKFFDLVADPGEQVDLAGNGSPQLATMQERMQESLIAWHLGLEGNIPQSIEISEEAMQRLRALGYIQ